MSVFSKQANSYIQLISFDDQKHSLNSIHYGVVESPFGSCFIAQSIYGICQISFCVSDDVSSLVEELQAHWPKAEIAEDQVVIAKLSKQVFSKDIFSKPTLSKNNAQALNVIVSGTEFQLRVWQTLLEIPQGECCAYSDIADLIGSPKAYRAVGSAVGMNPVAYLIPCHRVIQKNGALGGYRWGIECKKRILAQEKSLTGFSGVV